MKNLEVTDGEVEVAPDMSSEKQHTSTRRESVAPLENDDIHRRGRYLSRLDNMEDAIGRSIYHINKRNHKIQISVLLLSIVTTTSITALLSSAFPHIFKWIVPISSSLTTLLTVYQGYHGPLRVLEERLQLLERVSKCSVSLKKGYEGDYLSEYEAIKIIYIKSGLTEPGEKLGKGKSKYTIAG